MIKDALYYSETPVREFTAEVTACRKAENAGEGWECCLSVQGFYPEGGGQESDRGWIGEACVLDVQENADTGEVIHLTDRALTPGQTLQCRIDWARRMRNSRNHSGEHIISGLIYRDHGFHNVGFHMGDVMTIDFDGVLDWEQLKSIEAEANRIVMENRPVRILWPDPESLKTINYRSKKELSGDVRLVDLGGADLCACCGTHVYRTGEIGLIKLLTVMKRKNGIRATLVCGEDAVKTLADRYDTLQALCRTLSAAPEELEGALTRVLNESRQKDQRIAALNTRYYEQLAEKLKDTREMILCFEDGMNGVELRKCCDYFMKHTAAPLIGVFGKTDEGYQYVIGSNTIDLREKNRTFTALTVGQGGGQKEMLQGRLKAGEDKIREAVRIFLEEG